MLNQTVDLPNFSIHNVSIEINDSFPLICIEFTKVLIGVTNNIEVILRRGKDRLPLFLAEIDGASILTNQFKNDEIDNPNTCIESYMWEIITLLLS